MRLLLAIMAACACWHAAAQSAPRHPGGEWKLIGEHELFNMYIHPGSVAPQGRHKKAWLLTVYRSERNDAGTPKPYRATRTLTYFDCAARKVGSKQIAFFDSQITDGVALETATREDSAVPFADAAPGTFMDSALRVACR
jgi:hypothetical protein